MARFRCKECSRKFKSGGIYQHVFGSEHCSVIDMQTEKDLQCESCREADLKNLQILKFGSGNWYLFCLTCSDGKDSTDVVDVYSANDGKLWKVWNEFLDVKDAMKPESEKLLEEYNLLLGKYSLLKDRINNRLKNSQPNSKRTQSFVQKSRKSLKKLHRHLNQLKLKSQFIDDRYKTYEVLILDALSEFNSLKLSESQSNSDLSKGILGGMVSSKYNFDVVPASKVGNIREEEGEDDNALFSFNRKIVTQSVPLKKHANMDALRRYFSIALFMFQRLDEPKRFLLDFNVRWYRKRNWNTLEIAIPIADNPEVMKVFPKVLLKQGRLPFTRNQMFFVTSNNEGKIWYAYAAKIDYFWDEYFYTNEPIYVGMTLIGYPWNKNNPVHGSLTTNLKVFPSSIDVSRIFYAMSHLDSSNYKFKNLYLGKDPVSERDTIASIRPISEKKLNESQLKAIEYAMNHSVTFIQGPPGSGKTSTIEQLIWQLLETFHSSPILCVAVANIAIDNIAEKFLGNKQGIFVLRVVGENKQEEYDENHPIGSVCLHNIIFGRLSANSRNISRRLLAGDPTVTIRQSAKLAREERRLSEEIVSSAKIIFSTNISAGGSWSNILVNVPFVIMDESTQSTEPSTFVPLTKRGLTKAILVGDEKQLSCLTDIPQLKVSLFEKALINGCGLEPQMMNIQYRMHPQISEFPEKRFYQGKLKDGITAEDRQWPGIKYPLYFQRCSEGSEEVVCINERGGGQRYTFINCYECNKVLKILHKLIIDKKVKQHDIGVVTPYSAQRQLISQELLDDCIVNPEALEMEEETDITELGANKRNRGSSVNIINGLYVASIDAFQGHEKNFIVFCCVRNNTRKSIGFLGDGRRLNVALTRARYGLIVIGNDLVLKQGNNLWRDYIEYLEDKGLIFTGLDSF